MSATPTSSRPWWVRLIGWLAIWCGFLAAAVYLLRNRPLLTPIVPLAALGVWLLVISAGEAWLGWTA